ncbi:protein RTM1 [Apiospora kogelbergensis]|uniref:protein RTM1 n=1 Tax=Apiospora kogelbergensis TaxID=1337665 RepID=UPI00312FA1BF
MTSSAARTSSWAGWAYKSSFFGAFCIVTTVFHLRIRRNPTGRSDGINTPWQPLIFVLYGASLLILVRSVFRIAEYADGSHGALQTLEYWLYIFDAVLMLAVSVMFNWLHPSYVICREGKGSKGRSAISLEDGVTTYQVRGGAGK